MFKLLDTLAGLARRLPRSLLSAAIVLVAGGVGLGWGSWQNLCATCPSIAQIRTFEPQQTSKLFDREGRLIVELGSERRTPVSIHAIPEYVPQAVIAIEDRRFHEHDGYDLRGIARAASGRLLGQYRGGGSTITQQLARNMFKEEIGFERRYTRKLRELQVALELEAAYEKEQILESYLNQVYMGRGWGFESAARAYFGETLAEVDVAEAALLAAILNRPGYFDPYTNPEPTLARRNTVLNLMADQGYLSREEAERWKEAPLPTTDHSGDPVYGIAPYFEEWVRQILTSRFGGEVYSGGLRVYTTLDREMQVAANEAMEWGWNRIEGLANFAHPPKSDFDTISAFEGAETPYLQGMFIALDPENGAVRAMIGGRDFRQSEFDRVRLARRQPGSAFKPFVYTAAIASGIPASHIVVDQPFIYEQVNGETWRPRNFDPEFRGPITIREGLRRSINTIAIKLGWEEVGIETVAQTARRMGIRTEIERFPSTTIGAAEVIPLQLAEAYTTFATLGTRVQPFPIARVEDANGNVLWEPQPERTRVLEPEVARIMVDMLQDAANAGTGGNHRATAFPDNLPWGEVPTAGKTGTTNDGTNTWFMGFTPNLTAGVWFGMDRPVPMARGRSDIQATGGGYAAPVWGRFMRSVYYGMSHLMEGEGEVPSDWFEEPALEIPDPWEMLPGLTTFEIDAKSGRLWSRWCSEENRYTEIFIPGTEPTEQCDETGRRFRIRGVPDLGGLGR